MTQKIKISIDIALGHLNDLSDGLFNVETTNSKMIQWLVLYRKINLSSLRRSDTKHNNNNKTFSCLGTFSSLYKIKDTPTRFAFQPSGLGA